MTTPSILPVGYKGDYRDYLMTKVDRSGAERILKNTVSVPSGTTTTTIIGLAPFNKGAELGQLYAFVAALGTSVTIDLGYVYDDNTNNTNKSNAFLAASTVAAAGGLLSVNTADPCTWTATANGWLVAVIGGATTGSTGILSYRIGFAYDIGGLSN